MTTKKSTKKTRSASKKSTKPTKTLQSSTLVLNPFTGKFVSTSTSLGKRLEFLVSLCNKCPEGSIYNYKTKRCAKPVGKIGKILADEIDFCKKYKIASDAYEKIDVELVRNIGEIELPKKYLGENVKIRELVKVIDDDQVLNKLIKDNLPSSLKDNMYVAFMISILLVILKLVVGGGPISEYVYETVSKLIRKANKTFTSIYISTLLNRVKNPDMLNMIYTFSFSSLCLFLVFIHNTFKNFKTKEPKSYEQSLKNINPQKYRHIKWITLDKVPNFERTYSIEELINEDLVKKEIDKQTGKKSYKINAIELGIQTQGLTQGTQLIKAVTFDSTTRLLSVKYEDLLKKLHDPDKYVTILFNLEIDIKEKNKKKKIQELYDLLHKLDETFKRVENTLKNEKTKLTAFNMLEAIKAGRYSEEDYTKEAILNMKKNIENYTPIPDNLKENLLNNISKLEEYIEKSKKTFYEDVGKMELSNINAGYDRLKNKIIEAENAVNILTNLDVAFISPQPPQVINYPQKAINGNINKQPGEINYTIKPDVIKTKEEIKKEIDAEATRRRIVQETKDILYGKPKEVNPSDVLLKLMGSVVPGKGRSNGSPKKIMPRKKSI